MGRATVALNTAGRVYHRPLPGRPATVPVLMSAHGLQSRDSNTGLIPTSPVTYPASAAEPRGTAHRRAAPVTDPSHG
eukprot:1689414-Rhodomonas_salina.1